MDDSQLAGFAKALLDDETARRFQQHMDALGGGTDGAAVDASALSGLLTGLERTNVLQHLQDVQNQREDALVDVREIAAEQNGIRVVVGAHVFVSEPPEATDVYRGDDHLLVRTAQGEEEVTLTFEPGSIEWADTDGIAEFVVWRDEEVAGALPEPNDEE